MKPDLESAVGKAIEAYEDLAAAYNEMGWELAAEHAQDEANLFKFQLKRLRKRKRKR